MRRFPFVLLALFFAVLLPAESVELKIYFTSDTHAHFETRDGGWLKLAPLIKKECADRSDMLLIDCGDTLQGTIEGAYDKGAAVIRTMNHLKYDAWVIGNHDIEFEFPALRQRAKEFDGAVLGGNLIFPGGKKELASWRLFEKAGVKIAVIGMTLPNMHDDVRFEPEIRASSQNITDALYEIMPEIRRFEPGLIVLAMHAPQRSAGFSVFDVIRDFPEINLVIGAHSHKSVPGEKMGSAWYVQTGAHARELGKVTIFYDREAKRPVRILSSLLKVSIMAEPDEELSTILNDYLKQTGEFKHKIVGKAEAPIAGPEKHNAVNAPVGQLMAQAMCRSTGADLALLSVNTQAGLEQDITENDLFNIMPYENTVAVIPVTVADLKIILNEQLANNRDYYASIFYGLKVPYDTKKKQVAGIYDETMKLVPDDKVFKLAVANYLLISNRFGKLQAIAKQNRVSDRAADPLLRDCVRDYVRANSPLEPPREEWLIKK